MSVVGEAPCGFLTLSLVLIEQLKQLIDGDRVVFSHLYSDEDSGFCVVTPDRENLAERMDAYEAYREEHPLMRHFTRAVGGHSVQFDELVPRRDLREMAIFQEFFRPLGILQMLGIVIPVPAVRVKKTGSREPAIVPFRLPTQLGYPNISFCLTRAGGPFSDCETAVFDLFSSQVRPILLREIAWERRAGTHMEVDFQLTDQSTAVTELPFLARIAEQAGLTRRQTEVLSWVAQGKTNDEIATILGNSVRTIEGHVDSLLEKLNVENRVAAGYCVWTGRPNGPRGTA
ncbi:MAG: LuxR C-terminal-related transcriptional regulator [Opitutaceae bacterium]